jgi:hypothetical protein
MVKTYPKDFSPPEPLSEERAAALATVLQGFRLLYELLDDVLLPGSEKSEAIASLVRAKRSADDAVKHRVPKLTLSRVADLFAGEERHDRRVEAVVLSNADFCDLKLDPGFSESFWPEVQIEALAAGVVGSGWGALFRVHSSIPAGSAFLLTDKDKTVSFTKAWKAPKKKLVQI